ncbi:MAG TPA: ABC transporter permease [Candidatus Moranbacteria bacterium]|nr:ABC transporter permease [Candidatus Moranbacteria bacterium]
MAAKFRSFLTILGIIIGVASVIIIMAIGQSAQALILDQVSGIGSNLIGILPGASDEKGPPAAAMGIKVKTLKYGDLEALRNGKNVIEIENAAGYVMGSEVAKYKGENLTVSFTGTTASYINVENSEVEEGRFINETEEKDMSRVAVIGKNIVRDLFLNEDPIGKTFTMKDQSFTVIGVFKSKGGAGFGTASADDSVFIPLVTAQRLMLGIDHIAFIRAKVKSADLIPYAIANTKATLRERHNIDNPANDDFSIRDQAQALEMVKNITNVLRYFLLAIGTISLVVGGVGIMNTMLIVVNQRIREVGLRKAVGAKTNNILMQFLVESAAISFFGGVFGIILGIIVSFIAAIVMQALKYNWPFLISWQSIVVATLVSIGIGVIFGMYPARKASKISPMEALRYE